MTTHLSSTSSLPFTHREAGFEEQGNTSAFPDYDDYDDIFQGTNAVTLFLISIFYLTCALGLMGNGTVLWYLCFVIKKNPITTYVLNLAAADSAVLICLFCMTLLSLVEETSNSSAVLALCFFLAYSSSQYLLTAISIEKCLSVIFPIWYRCHRPECLSAIICVLLWIMPSLLLGLLVFINVDLKVSQSICIINFILCTPLVIMSTAVLFIRVFCSLHRRQRGRFYTVLLITLLVFLLFGTPLSIMLICIFFGYLNEMYMGISLIGACINSSVNPLIYFLIGRKKMHQSKETLRLIFRRVFSDNVGCRESGQSA
ncbi:mas-related G-protein coupled receptor member H [Anolis carolinensis]|uniref:mas-related G-protein coupled receptor member H n=1 Tax=Anolis carolinensis TaxID=28377 RepID=UPI000462A6FF|nr:PREDICTED: mas-related G-protein coupled receptor member H [Anolis carolinensis]|eukprot:XP_008106527.1 PREDICTED: mas-related G-protein coupled receptor member H [Anolis carolinensis]